VGVFRQLMRTGGVVSDDARLRPSFCPSFFNVPDVCPEPVLVIILSLSVCVCLVSFHLCVCHRVHCSKVPQHGEKRLHCTALPWFALRCVILPPDSFTDDQFTQSRQ
jgi:hypothetical protein